MSDFERELRRFKEQSNAEKRAAAAEEETRRLKSEQQAKEADRQRIEILKSIYRREIASQRSRIEGIARALARQTWGGSYDYIFRTIEDASRSSDELAAFQRSSLVAWWLVGRVNSKYPSGHYRSGHRIPASDLYDSFNTGHLFGEFYDIRVIGLSENNVIYRVGDLNASDIDGLEKNAIVHFGKGPRTRFATDRFPPMKQGG